MAEVTPGAVAPEVPVVPAADAAPTPDTTAVPAVDAPDGGEPAKPERTFTQAEVDRIAARRAAQAERSALKIARAEAESAVLRRQLEDRDRQQPQPQGEPKQKDFTDYEEYLLARAEWRFDQKQAKARETNQRETQTQRQQSEFAERARFVQENIVKKGVEKYGEDFRDAVLSNEDTPISEVMVAAASRLPNGADTLFHLAKNDPAELQRIFSLPDVEQVWEIKAASNKLTASPAPTRTPAPIVPNSGNATVRKGTFDLSVNNSAEWKDFVARRRKELGRR